MLPRKTESHKYDEDFICLSLGKFGENSLAEWADIEADARAKMLVYLIENKLLTTHSITD